MLQGQTPYCENQNYRGRGSSVRGPSKVKRKKASERKMGGVPKKSLRRA
jgi:hypothetical protein